MTMLQRYVVVGLFAALSLLSSSPFLAQALIVGVNVVNPMRASVADQNALLAQLKALGQSWRPVCRYRARRAT